MAFAIKAQPDIISDALAWIASHSPQITDLSVGSIVRSEVEAFAQELQALYVENYIAYQGALENLKSDLFGLTKKAGNYSTGFVVFSRITATSQAVPIITGTRIQTSGGLVYTTTADTAIPISGTDSPSVAVRAIAVGKSFNTAAATITSFVNGLDGVDTVTNALPTTGGVDEETEAQYQRRFQEWVEGLAGSNGAGLRAAALSVVGITSASSRDLIPPVGNVNGELYVDDGSAGGPSVALVAQVQAVINGDGSPTSPGYKAGGVNIVVKAPTTVTQNIVVQIYLSSGAVNQTATTSALLTALTNYINNLGIGEDIIFIELGALCLDIPGIVDANFTTPAGNVPIAATQVARIGTFSVSYILPS